MRYTKQRIRIIADNYSNLHGFTTIDDKIDFDMALRSLGKGAWTGGNLYDFCHYHQYGKLQKVIIARILGIPDEELDFTRIPQLRGIAYFRMADWLNR